MYSEFLGVFIPAGFPVFEHHVNYDSVQWLWSQWSELLPFRKSAKRKRQLNGLKKE